MSKELNTEKVSTDVTAKPEVTSMPVKSEIKSDKKDKSKKKEKKPNVLGRKFKELGSELKKVTWPSFAQVLKQTGIVLAVVIIFTVILFGVDRLLGWLFELLTSSLA